MLSCTLFLVAEALFDGLQIDGETAYFTTSCASITGAVFSAVQRAFIELLQSQGE